MNTRALETTDITANDVMILVDKTIEATSDNELYKYMYNNTMITYKKDYKIITYLSSAIKRILDIMAGLIRINANHSININCIYCKLAKWR